MNAETPPHLEHVADHVHELLLFGTGFAQTRITVLNLGELGIELLAAILSALEVVELLLVFGPGVVVTG